MEVDADMVKEKLEEEAEEEEKAEDEEEEEEPSPLWTKQRNSRC